MNLTRKRNQARYQIIKKRLHIVPGAPTLKFSQGNQNSCIISSLASALYYMGDELASEYIIRRKQNSLSFIHNIGQMQFYRDILTGQYREKNEIKVHYYIQERHKFTTYDILHNQSNYPTVCFLLDTAHWANHCITVCGKWIFDSNLKLALPLTRDWLNYICYGNDTDEITFVGVLYAIR